MSSRLVYFGNVISRTKALVDANLIREPVWLKPALKSPPLSKPISPEMPSWETIVQTKTHRVGPMLRKDGHRFDPKKPTEMPKDTSVDHPQQPYHVFFSKDNDRREYFSAHPEKVITIDYNPDAVSWFERSMRGEDAPASLVGATWNQDRDLYEVWENASNPDVSDIEDKLRKLRGGQGT